MTDEVNRPAVGVPLHGTVGRPVPERKADGMPTSADERKLRRMYAVRVNMPNLYMDDGEASGSEHGISIDFMREPVADIAAKVLALEVARFECRETPNGKFQPPAPG
jgi:hypothetical protein